MLTSFFFTIIQIQTPYKCSIYKEFFFTVNSGYELDKKFRIGARYNAMYDGKKYSDASLDHDLSGDSIYSTYVINDKFEIFGRYDHQKLN